MVCSRPSKKYKVAIFQFSLSGYKMLIFKYCHLTVITCYCLLKKYVSGILNAASIDAPAKRRRRYKTTFLLILKAPSNVTLGDENNLLRHTSEKHDYQREGEDPGMVRDHSWDRP